MVFLTLTEQQRLEKCEDKIPKRIFVPKRDDYEKREKSLLGNFIVSTIHLIFRAVISIRSKRIEYIERMEEEGVFSKFMLEIYMKKTSRKT